MADTLEFDTTLTAKNARTNAFLDSINGKNDEDVRLRTVYTLLAAFGETNETGLITGMFNLMLIEDRLGGISQAAKDKAQKDKDK